MKHFLLITFTLLLFNASAQETTNTKFGKGMINLVAKDSSWSVQFAPRIQFLTSVDWKNENGNLGDANTNFLIRRARLKFSGFAYSPKLRYKLELGLSNRDVSGGSKYTGNTPRVILDAVVKWNFYKNFVLWAGQTKLPGNVERVVSSANLQLVDRSILNARFNIDRDIGFQLRHHFNLTDKFVIREIIAFSQGEGRNITTGNEGGLQYTGRLEFLPFGTFKNRGDYKGSDLKREQTPKLAVSISYDFNNNAVKTRSNMGSYMETDIGLHETNISTTFIDAMFKYRGFSIMTEFANRTAEDPFAKNEDGSETGLSVQEGSGFNFMSGYLFKNNWEVTGRYSIVDLKRKDASGQYTFGVSKYIVGHKLKVQTDITYLSIAGVNEGLLYRLQLDVHF